MTLMKYDIVRNLENHLISMPVNQFKAKDTFTPPSISHSV